ncbi:hypothetical protein [Brevibacillus laterosporus]|uniref:hypothetical protein n=1 Tax=Brevibacillus laterosporus TaxID=1465 RepID=UPI0018F898BE|nr:hypothetical protein [Brevibacillus laterosporus]MBG9774236.1 hypothetical protein [Brevibacillus laterosporus]
MIELTMMERTTRINWIKDVLDRYVETRGDGPSSTELEQLADVILHEELTDPDAYKGTHNEYPILSETQLARRREGKHKRRGSGMGGEASLAIAQETGTDGRSYRKPARRKRSPYENRFVDENAQIRNKQRREQYEKYRKPGEVKQYFIA